MVSLLWKACADGDLALVQSLLKEASPIDIEVKDSTGATPLIQGIKNGHVEIVKALLDAGADATIPSSEGSPEQFTSDPAILELLNSAREKKSQIEPVANGYYPAESYPQEYQADLSKAYYGQPHGSYMYYPPIHPGTVILPDGSPAPYYAPQPPPPNGQPPSDPNGGGSLPPPEIAKLIPCRYFPACRYGSSCMFAHPQGPYFQGPMPPPAQYPAPYDPMMQAPFAGGYYAIPQTPYPPNGAAPSANTMSPPVSTQSPTPQQNHMRNGSELVSPLQVPYGAPPPLPYGMTMSAAYPQPGQLPLPPVPVGMPPLPPPQQPLVSSGPPNGYVYQPTSPIVQTHNPALLHRRNSSVIQNIDAPLVNGVPNNHVQPLTPQVDGFPPNARSQARENSMHGRRGSMRRLSTMGPSRKPPCLFFPSGRCRNGDACRFPHVMPDASDPSSGPQYPLKSRPRPHNQPVGDSLEEKLAGLNLRTDARAEAPQLNGNGHANPVQVNGAVRSHNAFRANHAVNGVRPEKRVNAARPGPQTQAQQRIPNPDEFPVLAGTITPPARSPGAPPLIGPTAAQVLQAPPPAKKQGLPPKGAETPAERSSSPQSSLGENRPDETNVNGHVGNGIHGSTTDIALNKSPVSFASIATASSNHTETANAVSVSA